MGCETGHAPLTSLVEYTCRMSQFCLAFWNFQVEVPSVMAYAMAARRVSPSAPWLPTQTDRTTRRRAGERTLLALLAQLLVRVRVQARVEVLLR